MGQHYIPQYYLNGFSDPFNPTHIWVYEKGTQRIFCTTTENVAKENRRWPEAVEQHLANRIEGPARPVLDKMRDRQPITANDKQAFSDYMVIMVKRVPAGLERMRANFPATRERVFAQLNAEILRLIQKDPSRKNIFQQLLLGLPALKAKYENEFPVEVWHNTLNLDSVPRVRAMLPAMTWTFLTSDKKQPFLTSDNPFFFFEELGIGRPESQITFPISSGVALRATWRKDLTEGYVQAKDADIRKINRRTASAATRWVYCSQKAQWVVTLVNKKNLRRSKLI
jgi:hypothetical protein